MLLHIGIECHRFIYHFFVDAAGIEQMQPILMPGSNTDMRGVQSLLSGYHQKDITILDGISEKLVVTNLPFRDIAIALAVDALLQSTDTRLPLRMSRKHLVTGRMGGHPVYSEYPSRYLPLHYHPPRG